MTNSTLSLLVFVLRMTTEAKVLTTYYALESAILVRLEAAVILTAYGWLMKKLFIVKNQKISYIP